MKYVDTLPENSTLLSGSLETSFSKIASGSHAQHSYVITFYAGNLVVTLPQASVTYKADADGTEQVLGVLVSCGLAMWNTADQVLS